MTTRKEQLRESSARIRQKRHAAGLVQVVVWVPGADKAAIQAAAERLRQARNIPLSGASG